MTRFVMPSHEEIPKAYLEGEKAVVALFERTIGQLAARVQTLEDQATKNSRNSSKLPPSDGLKEPAPRSLCKRSGKKRGGQHGRKGHTLKAVKHPQHIIETKSTKLLPYSAGGANLLPNPQLHFYCLKEWAAGT